jgi:protease IV
MKIFFKQLLATVLGFFVAIFLLVIVGGIVLAGMLAAFSDKEIKSRKNMVLELNLNYQIDEQTVDVPFLELIDKNYSQKLGLDALLYQIEKASLDNNVKGILLKPGMLSAGYATIDELRNALQNFRNEGKFVYAYCEYITEKNYLLATACDSIFLNPSGELLMNGLSSDIMFYKGLFDKIGVKMELFKVGTHKGAAEVFTQESLSEANKGQIQRYLDVLFDRMSTDVADSRNLNKADFASDVNKFTVRSPQMALAKGWIDALWYEDQLATHIKKRVGRDTTEKICYTPITTYRKMEGPNLLNETSKNKIAFVYIDGEITNNSANDNEAGCKSLLNSLRKVRYDDGYKALVLRINSPGGSAFGSDQIWREVSLIKEKKPVIVTMGDVAASGGYYIAAPADSILVSPYTITGSIGVFALYPNMQELLNNNLGINIESVKTGEFSDLGVPDKGFSVDERLIIQSAVNRIYANFTSVVRNGRQLDSSHVEEIAQGKVWIAADALQHKLVDKTGLIQDAITTALNMSGIKDKKDYKLVYLPKKDSGLAGMFSMYEAYQAKQMKANLGYLYPIFKTYEQLQSNTGYFMRLPYDPKVH